MVDLKIISSEDIQKEEKCKFKVNINDKVSKLSQLAGESGTLIFNGQVIEKPEDKTFVDMSICDGSKVVLTFSSAGGGEQLKWCRFPRMETRDYYHLSCNYADAVAFIPKRDIIFHGFGVLMHYNK